MSKADRLGGSATFDAVARPVSSRAASFARFAGQSEEPAPVVDVKAPVSPTLPLTALAHNPFNPREELVQLDDLADSLASRGVIQPLAVVTRAAFLAAHPDAEDALASAAYVVVDGNRRFAAARQAGLDDVPVYVEDSLALDADTLLETTLIAAVHNESLDPLDEAKALERLVSVHGSQRAVARALGKSSGWVTQRMALRKLDPDLQVEMTEGRLPVEIARRVGQMPVKEQQQAAREAMWDRTERRTRKGNVTAADGAGASGGAGESTHAKGTPVAVAAPERPAPVGEGAAAAPVTSVTERREASETKRASSSWSDQVPWEVTDEVLPEIVERLSPLQRRNLVKLLLARTDAKKQATEG